MLTSCLSQDFRTYDQRTPVVVFRNQWRLHRGSKRLLEAAKHNEPAHPSGELFARETFFRWEHAVAMFFDLKKAYDATWKYGILCDLHAAGLRGRLPKFIAQLLLNWQFKIRVGSCWSDLYQQEIWVLQGSILSVTLFLLEINSIVQNLPANVRYFIC